MCVTLPEHTPSFAKHVHIRPKAKAEPNTDTACFCVRFLGAGEFPENTGHVQLLHVLSRHRPRAGPPRVQRVRTAGGGAVTSAKDPRPNPSRTRHRGQSHRGGSTETHTHGFQLSPSPTQMAATPWKAGPAASSEHASRPSTRRPGTLCEGCYRAASYTCKPHAGRLNTESKRSVLTQRSRTRRRETQALRVHLKIPSLAKTENCCGGINTETQQVQVPESARAHGAHIDSDTRPQPSHGASTDADRHWRRPAPTPAAQALAPAPTLQRGKARESLGTGAGRVAPARRARPGSCTATLQVHAGSYSESVYRVTRYRHTGLPDPRREYV
ncbi:hypothetical protein H8959_016847 [Pygathrix nigripes]